MNRTHIAEWPAIWDPVDRQILKAYAETGTVPRDLFESKFEQGGGRGFLSKKILKSLLEPLGLWRLFKREEADELYRTRPTLIFPYTVGRRSFFRTPKVHKINLQLRPAFVDYTPSGGPRVVLDAY